MSAFNDGRCERCNKRMGWEGKATDKPKCPSCGYVPSAKEIAELEHDEKLMEELKKKLLGE